MPLPYGSEIHTKILGSTRLELSSPQTTTVGNVVYCEFPVPPKLSLPNAVDMDDLVAEFENQSAENAASIARGRQWVADTFYANRLSMARLRLQKGWSQAELAKRAETSQSHIARIESGTNDPQLSTLRKISKALDVPLATLIDALSTEGKA